MKKAPTIETSLTLSSDKEELVFSEISALLKKEPSDIRFYNGLTSWGSIPAIKSSEWTFSGPEEDLDSVDSGVCNLFDRFETDWLVVSDFCAQHGYEVTVVSRIKIYDLDNKPLIELGSGAIRALSRAGATWRADIEDYSDE